ncbi:hypothetical protein CDA09_13800 [Azoarcus sp. DN11]|nr:hypothetical protein CDA09_13800 [Azoarcus sp. DN11]
MVLDEESKRFSVWLPSPRYSRDWVSAREKDEPHYWQQKVPLEEFVQGALAGRLKYAPALGLRVPLEVYAGYDQCWRCKRETGRVLELRFDIGRVLPGCADLTTDLYGFAEHYPDGERLIHTLLPPARLREVGIGQLQRRFSKTEGQAYLSNGCVHCGALQGRFFDHEFYDGGDKVLETEAVLEEAFVRRRDNRNRVYRWWFDTRPSSMPSAAPTTALSSRDCE